VEKENASRTCCSGVGNYPVTFCLRVTDHGCVLLMIKVYSGASNNSKQKHEAWNILSGVFKQNTFFIAYNETWPTLIFQNHPFGSRMIWLLTLRPRCRRLLCMGDTEYNHTHQPIIIITHIFVQTYIIILPSRATLSFNHILALMHSPLSEQTIPLIIFTHTHNVKG
jgi:hypothetical protein